MTDTFRFYETAPLTTTYGWRRDGPRKVKLHRYFGSHSSSLWLATITAHGVAHGKRKHVWIMGGASPTVVDGSWAKAKKVAEVLLRLEGIEITKPESK